MENPAGIAETPAVVVNETTRFKPRRKPHRQFAWKDLLGDKAHSAKAISKMLGMQLPNTRRHLRWAVATNKLAIVRNGKLKYYLTVDTFNEWQRKASEEQNIESDAERATSKER